MANQSSLTYHDNFVLMFGISLPFNPKSCVFYKVPLAIVLMAVIAPAYEYSILLAIKAREHKSFTTIQHFVYLFRHKATETLLSIDDDK